MRSAFPEMKGFSRANLMYMRAFAQTWPDDVIVQQAVGQLPWGHNLVLLTQLKDPQSMNPIPCKHRRGHGSRLKAGMTSTE
ncbi:MAG: DUF1016 N-terminal domain-containing protein [Polaromonas sp.]